MREFLFKAQRISDRKWVEGSYLYCKGATTVSFQNEHYILVFDGYGVAWVEIDKNTICQYTGLTDKNGNKIWENDIIKDLINGDVYSCEWNHGNCEYELRNDKTTFGLGYAALYHYRVMGNVFDGESKNDSKTTKKD